MKTYPTEQQREVYTKRAGMIQQTSGECAILAIDHYVTPALTAEFERLTNLGVPCYLGYRDHYTGRVLAYAN